MRDIAHLPEQIAALPADIQRLGEQVLHIERLYGFTVPPPAMHTWIDQHFGSVAQVREQTIIKVTNRWTLDTASFNPLRAKRPLDGGDHEQANHDSALATAMDAYSGSNDTFDDPLHHTPADLFGRIRGEYCVTASNIAKYDRWHGLVIFDTFNPLAFTTAQFRDYCKVALSWLLAAHRQDPQACYPLITWNCLWKSGASLTHGHLQMVLARELVGGRIEQGRRAGVAYRETYGRSLAEDVWQIHAALGVAFLDSPSLGGYATLTPLNDRDVLLWCSVPELTLAQLTARQARGQGVDEDGLHERLYPLWDATSQVLRAMIDGQGMRSFNMAIFLPPLRPTSEPWDDRTVQVRIIDRGAPLARAVNVGAMEVFAHNIVSVDPFVVAAHLR